MTEQPDAYWDELGVAWRAMEVDIAAVTPRLRSRLRRQSLCIRLALAAGAPIAISGVVVGALTVWWGFVTATWNFVVRGIAIGVVAAIGLRMLWSLVPVRGHADARALGEMLDLAVRRARTTLVALRVGLFCCAFAAVLGVAGAIIRTRAGAPPALSPVADVVVLGLVAVILLVGRQRTVASIARLEYLARAVR